MENELEIVNAEIIRGLRLIEGRLAQIDNSIREGTRSTVIAQEKTDATLRRLEILLERRLP
jgi:hypothetical protein